MKHLILPIISIIATIVILFILYPFVNRFMTQVLFKSRTRTRKVLLRAYNFSKKQAPDRPEKELLLHTMQACFCILDRQHYPQKPYSTKPKGVLTEDDVNEMIEKATDINSLMEIVIERGLSPDLAPLF